MSRIRSFILKAWDSLWLLPAIFTIASVGLAAVTLAIDNRVIAAGRAQELWFLHGVGAEGARGVLDAIAAGIITVTGVVFSVTIVALQLASSQFTPRVLRGFFKDRLTQVVLGTFIGTFTYSMLVLRTVRAGDEDIDAFVPSTSVTVAVALALVSIAFLIFFINHIARSIQVAVIIDRATHDTVRVARKLFPEHIGRPVSGAADAADSVPAAVALGPVEPGGTILSKEAGYVQMVDEDALYELAEEDRLTVRMEVEIGQFVIPCEPLASVWPVRRARDRNTRRRIRRAFVLGEERTPYQDVERGLIELTDIAVKALSPSVNDPTTAVICVDRIGQILAELGTRRLPPRFRTAKDGRLLFIARRTDFERTVTLGLDRIRHYAANHPELLRRILHVLGRVALIVHEDRLPPLERQAMRTWRTAEHSVTNEDERLPIRRAFELALQKIRRRTESREAA